MLTKVRAVLAMGASIMVMISSLYNTTYAFTETIVQDILFEEQMHYLERPDEEADNDVTYFYESPSQETQKESLPPIEDEVSSLLRKVAKKDKKDKAKAIEKPAKEKPSKSKPTQKKESKDSQKKEEIDTTVIVTTNWMPGLPSTTMIDKVLDSLSHLKGLSNDYPLIIAVDGAYEQGGRSQSVRNVDMRAYIKALEKKYNNDRTTIITSSRKIMLVGNMKRALKKVNTEFILVLQHDLPFINDVNHTELIDTLHQYPEEVRLVRFATERILTRKRDSGICSGNIDFKAKKLELTKTHVWSDRNHLTRKSYYEEMFTLPGWGDCRNMEFFMEKYKKDKCSHWATYLYGPRGGYPSIFHLDGRRDGEHMTSTRRVYGNITGLL